MSKNLVTTDGKKREPSVSEWEEIELKPPIDKIADEFIRNTNQNVLVELVYSEDDTEAKNLKKFLKGLGFMVNKTDKDRSKLNNQIDGMWINKVHEKIEKQECDGLIMIFAKVDYKSEVMKNIWSQFTSNNCEKLKNKPKIFIFQIIKRAVTRDGTATTFHWAAAYETPAEADILIIHDRYDPDISSDLMETLKENIEEHGYREDIMSLICICSGPFYQPLKISTMTRKFYFQLHKHRGHHHHLLEKQNLIKEHIDSIKEIKQQQSANRKLKKRGNSFRNVYNYIKHGFKDDDAKTPEVKKPDVKSKETVKKCKESKTKMSENDGISKQPSTSKSTSAENNILETSTVTTNTSTATATTNTPMAAATATATTGMVPNRKISRSETPKASITASAQRRSRRLSSVSNSSVNSSSSKQSCPKKIPWKP